MTEICSRRDLICFSHLRWHFVTQRPQHLMTRAARDRRVFFFEEPIFDATEYSYLEAITISARLHVLRPHLLSGTLVDEAQATLLDAYLAEQHSQEYDAWFYTPMACAFTGNLHPRVIVYDCMDELKNFLNAPPQLIQYEHELLLRADVVFTGGRSLYEAKRKSHPKVSLFPSSIDKEHFAKALSPDIQEPADQAMLPLPRAGFYGVVDERFDLKLLRNVAEACPQTHFVILGPVVKIDPATLPQSANIHYLGAKAYETLPNYLSGWSAAILPFALNDATKFISPTKTPEYLAALRPVISTPIQDVVSDYGEPGLVEIAGTDQEFAAAVKRATLTALTKQWEKKVKEALSHMSWDGTWKSMQKEMDAADADQTSKSRDTKLQGRTASRFHIPTSTTHPFRVTSTANVHPTALHARPAKEFEVLVVGAGFAGSVMAERIASQLGRRVIIIDKRDHIAGNAYDHYDEHGILVHRYGPHIFHTNSNEVVRYLSGFTKWRPYEHRVLASVRNKFVPVPINLRTINELYGLDLDADAMQAFVSERAIAIKNIRTSEDIVLSRVGRELYELFFRNYTRKQWGLDPSQLDSSVAGRIPVRFSTDDRYFTDNFQAMPLDGYTRMFGRMLDHPNITVQLGTTFDDVRRQHPDAHVVYTGPIDEYFDFCYGPLPYRSLEFRHETHNVDVRQPAAVLNFPNEHDYTRVTEFKWLTGQAHDKTSIVYEYPRESGDPYYPIPRPENAALYARYKKLADDAPEVTFCGRLANYKYFNMDQVVAQALHTFDNLVLQQDLLSTGHRNGISGRQQERYLTQNLLTPPQSICGLRADSDPV